MGGVQNGQNIDYVILEWPLTYKNEKMLVEIELYVIYLRFCDLFAISDKLQSCAFEIERPGDQVHIFCCHF